MKILVLSSTPWNDDNSFGSTFSNFFNGMDNVEIANIYCKPGLPHNNINISKYFQITEKSLLLNLKNKSIPSGHEVTVVNNEETSVTQHNEPSVYNFARKHRWFILDKVRRLIWKIGRWKSKELIEFIDDFNPDIIFNPMYFSCTLNEIGLFIKKHTNAPVVGYVSDDIYTLNQYSFSPMFWFTRLHVRTFVKKMFSVLDRLYVISEIQKKEYDRIFNIDSKILTKCCDFSQEVNLKKEYNSPLKIVFTGNLGNGRWQTIGLVVDALKKINQNEYLAELFIYSATPLTSKQLSAISDNENSFFKGSVSSDKVKEIQNDADILIHVEGFDKKNRLQVHQSFSTKIVDYLHMGRPMFAVGPSDVASIDYLIRNDSAVVASDKNTVYEMLLSLVESEDKRNEYALKGYECGKRNHEKTTIQKNLYNDLDGLINNK